MAAPDQPAPATAVASFADSLLPMLIADDERNHVDANGAACLLFRLDRTDLLRLRVDDVTPPEQRAGVVALWDELVRTGTRSGTLELLMPDGQRLPVGYSATANIRPGRHLLVLSLTSRGEPGDGATQGPITPSLLTPREREVLTLIARGERGVAIARRLGVSPATVEAHVRNCLAKLGASNRAHAIAIAIQHGELSFGFPAGAGTMRSRQAERSSGGGS
jgi:DNA-binding CsgD family transcriptional regulator